MELSEVKKMNELKERACACALDLLALLEEINDEEFIDTICCAVNGNDSYTLGEIQGELACLDEEDE